MLIYELNDKIKQVCPIIGISSDGKIDFADNATENQRNAAQAIMDAELPELGNPSPQILILQQIAALEATITERRIREATIAAAKTASSRSADDIAALAFMNDINAQIAELRGEL